MALVAPSARRRPISSSTSKRGRATLHGETALKARYCAQMMAGAAVLAGTAPDDFRRRVLARWVFARRARAP